MLSAHFLRPDSAPKRLAQHAFKVPVCQNQHVALVSDKGTNPIDDLIARISHSLRWWFSNKGRALLGASVSLREVAFPRLHLQAAACHLRKNKRTDRQRIHPPLRLGAYTQSRATNACRRG
jgi:hypothetical protein